MLSNEQARAAIPKIERRIADVDAIEIDELNDEDGDRLLNDLSTKIDSTLRAIFGKNSLEYRQNQVGSLNFYPRMYGTVGGPRRTPIDERRASISQAIKDVRARLSTILDLLKEQNKDAEESASGRALRAYQGLNLHNEIERAASALYGDGHYSNAVEAAVKALNGLVRLRSGLELDGSALMEKAFAPKGPVLSFNALQSQSDTDEQRGFMMLFCGAVAGLRNPRAHGFIEDDPERALEFIAFVSLLAKLLDGAKKV
jgi:uncharacterized protein (TIGR02391 family)